MSENDLRNELKQAMRDRDSLRTRVLRNVLAAVKNKQIEKRTEVTAAEVVGLIQREAKQCRETLEFARESGRSEVIADQEQVVAVLESLLPQQMTEADLKAAIQAIIAATESCSLGDVMKQLTAAHAGTYDGRSASRLAKELLG